MRRALGPQATGITLPISVTYANHRDLLGDADEVVGHIGFTFDMRTVFKTQRQ